MKNLIKIVILNIGLGLIFLCDNSCSSADDQPNPPNPIDTTHHTAKCPSDKSTPAITGISDWIPLQDITLPAGFKIEIFAEVPNARQLAVSPSGIVYVGNDGNQNDSNDPFFNRVYALKDTDGDHKADKKWVIASGLNHPNGVAFKDGDLYIGEVNRITKISNIEDCLDSVSTPIVIKDFPNKHHHGSRYISFGPDGKLYIPVGNPCDGTECTTDDPIFGTITRMNSDGSNREIYVQGVRNSVGIAWHPVSNELWFTDPGRNGLPNDEPSCELNNVTADGMNFGFPYCHAGVPEPDLGPVPPCSDFTAPAEKLGGHITPLGLKFYTGNMFPSSYTNQLFVALHGSYVRKPLNGHSIILVKMEENNKSNGFETFAEGWLFNKDASSSGEGSWGRPVDVLVLADGSILVSDDKAGVIYRISYSL